ncbi:probable serine/threonine-protein kinase STY8 at C-terminar half [Coccomyxa sp. Obi]|nr:probable serine/threonine-protein kinase STY8 at C-terminar half [Coccomyxa sp. Obi]
MLCFFEACIAQPAGLPSQPNLAPAPAPLLLVSSDDWTGLRQPGSGRPIGPDQLSVPPGATEVELQLTGPDALATDNVMDTMRSTLAEYLPVTYNAISPIAYKNVTSCPETASPAPAPIGPIGLPTLSALPPSSNTLGGRRLLQRWPARRRHVLQAEPALAPMPSSDCDPKMRAIFLLFYPPEINATYGQSLVRDCIQSGVFVTRLKQRKLDINRVELLASMRGDSPELAYRNTPQPLGMSSETTPIMNLAPAPSFDAAAQAAIANTSPSNHTVVDVYFTLVLTGYDAVETNGNVLLALTKMLTDTLYTGDIDYLTPENTAVTDVQQLKALTFPPPGGRRLLQANPTLKGASKVDPLKALGHMRKGHPKIVGGSRAGKVGASDGRPRKGQDPTDVDTPGFELEVVGGALKGQPQMAQLNSAGGGISMHLPGSASDEDAREAMEIAGGLMDGRPRKGHGSGGDSAADSAAAGDLKRRPGRGSRGASGYGERILTRLGAIRIRAPGANPEDGEGESLEGVSRPLSAKTSSNATAEGEYQKWGDRLASRTGELCNLREGARVAGTHCLRRRSLQQAPPSAGGPPSDAAAAPTAAEAPAPSPANASELSLVYFGPVPSLAVSYEVFDVPEPGPAVVADKLSYFIRTGQMVRLFQAQGVRIDYVQLAKYSPLPGVPAPAPSDEAAAATSEAGVSKIAKLVGAIVIPVAFVAILAASIFAYLFFRNKKRHSTAGSEGRPVKDSAQSMHSARSSDRSGLRTSGSGTSTTVRSMLDTLYSSHRGITGQEALALASLSKRSLTLPGMGSDWEIDPDELEICRRPDGTEWELGSGASAKVYKAVRNGVQVVAVKIFTDQVTAEHQARYAEAFRREIFILRSCHDRNIVQFIGACLQEGQTILVQEYMENGDLFHAIAEDTQSKRFGWYRERLPNGRLAPATGMARRIALDIARGLFFLHSRKVVHFDLKSANILLGRDWTAKIADVGLAKILKDGWLSTLREVGTFSWAAPEVLLGRPCTEKVDIYSFGVMLWELSAGEAPPGRHLRPLRVPEECPADVEAIIARCLDNEPENRPSARELVDFMVELPHALSREGGSGAADISSSGALAEPEQLLTTGKSLPPVSPKPPPAGMVLPNVFGLQSMLSFKRSNSGLNRSASGRLDRSNSGRSRTQSGEAPPARQESQASSAPASKPPKPQRSKPVVPSAFTSWASLSFKKDLGPVPPDAPSHPDAPEEELEQAVMQSNTSLSAAAAREAEKQVQEALRATGEAPEDAMAPGGYPARGAALGGPRKTVHFSDDENDPAAYQKRHAPAGASAGAVLGNEAASSQAREEPAAGKAARPRHPGRIASPFAAADEKSSSDQAASEAPAAPAKRTPPVVSSPFAAADSASEAPVVSARRAPVVSSPFASADSASEHAAASVSQGVPRPPAGRPPLVSSPFAAADAASEAPVAPTRKTPLVATPFAAAQAPPEAPSASMKSRSIVSSPFAAADDAGTEQPPAVVGSPCAENQKGADVAAAAPKQAAPRKFRPPVIRSAFEQ